MSLGSLKVLQHYSRQVHPSKNRLDVHQIPKESTLNCLKINWPCICDIPPTKFTFCIVYKNLTKVHLGKQTHKSI